MFIYPHITPALVCASICTSLVWAQTQPPSPVDLRLAAAQKQLQANPNSADALNNLAFALIRKGRDLRDENVYLDAARSIDKALQVSPGNFDAQKLRVAVLLGLHQPNDALKLATELNHKVPDDIAVRGLLVDANADLGNYDEAEHAAQWVLDLRPGSSLGFEKAAALRELFGDTEGSVEFLDEANRRTSQNDGDQKAWLLTQKARLILATGNAKAADAILAEALRLFPDSQLAESILAHVRIAQANYPEAVSLLDKLYSRVPNAENLYDLAEAVAASGQTQAASLKFASFEKQARTGNGAMLQLISYYSDTKPDLGQALTLATAEAAKRQDSSTLAVYAWALYRNGRFAEADQQMEKALAVGVQNPLYFCHAAAIATMAKNTASAERYSRKLSALPPFPCSATNQLQSANQAAR